MDPLRPQARPFAPSSLYHALSAAAHIGLLAAGGALVMPVETHNAFSDEVPRRDLPSMFRVSAEAAEATSNVVSAARAEAETSTEQDGAERNPDITRAEEDESEMTALGYDEPDHYGSPGFLAWPPFLDTRLQGAIGDPYFVGVGPGTGKADSPSLYATRKAVKNAGKVVARQDRSSETNGASRQTRKKVCPPSVPGVYATFCEWRGVEVLK